MTSMPASRSARAMTLAPRSCPSRPGLAMTMRMRSATSGAYIPASRRDLSALRHRIARRSADNFGERGELGLVGRRDAPAPVRHRRLLRDLGAGLGVVQRQPRPPLDVADERGAELR